MSPKWLSRQGIIPDTTALLLGLVENRICAVLSPTSEETIR
jgi:hypothetical protein